MQKMNEFELLLTEGDEVLIPVEAKIIGTNAVVTYDKYMFSAPASDILTIGGQMFMSALISTVDVAGNVMVCLKSNIENHSVIMEIENIYDNESICTK